MRDCFTRFADYCAAQRVVSVVPIADGRRIMRRIAMTVSKDEIADARDDFRRFFLEAQEQAFG